MKKFVKLLYVSIVIVLIFMMGCKKEYVAPSFEEFCEGTGSKITDGEEYVDQRRGGLSHPDACDAIAILITDGINTTLQGELISQLDVFVISATDAYRNQEEYENIWNWWNVTRSKIIKELQGKDKDLFNDQVVRVLPIFSKMLEERIIPYVIDGICYGGGVRDDWTDQWIQNTFNDTIPYNIDHPSWKETPRMECYYYYYYYAVDPGNYAEAKSMGMPTPTIEEMQQMFTMEEIKSQTNLNVYRKETIKKYDFTKVNWKPVAVPATTK